jgi:hypothetical protein
MTQFPVCYSCPKNFSVIVSVSGHSLKVFHSLALISSLANYPAV